MINPRTGAIEISSAALNRVHFHTYLIDSRTDGAEVQNQHASRTSAVLSVKEIIVPTNIAAVCNTLEVDGFSTHPAVLESAGTVCTLNDPTLSESGIRVAAKVGIFYTESSRLSKELWSTAVNKSGIVLSQSLLAESGCKSHLDQIETRRLVTDKSATQIPRYEALLS